MSKRKGASGPGGLRIPRRTAEAELGKRIAEGGRLLEHPVQDREALKAVRSDYYKWDQVNRALLGNAFTTDEVVNEYIGGARILAVGGRTPSLQEEIGDLHRDIQTHVRRLEAILESLPYFDAPPDPPEETRSTGPAVRADKIFIVHGRGGLEHQVAHWVGQVTGLRTTLLSEEAHRGRTILEKFLAHSEFARFAIVIMTGDDHGSNRMPMDSPEQRDGALAALQPRARQNVVLELGFYFGRLGRENVAVLADEAIEVPSDLAGLGVIPIDRQGAWRSKLAKELRAAEIVVDESQYP